ncbi:unnamed protein product [Diabrotica balteata]|uniref:Major facilitator superfamily (MFS) profile domain-containing protein n=1 Tax=Diabrotica balteata TaxID=107213 RepID=A0A9N9XEF7_DIABA|nr:unnamed protein product [Diabrotica balteata]
MGTRGKKIMQMLQTMEVTKPSYGEEPRGSEEIEGLDFIEAQGEDFERALDQTGFGKFHFSLLTICGLIYLNTAVGITIISFVLPSATCDFQMSSSDKGWLTAAPMLGMVIGSYFWGCLADTKGRKIVLIGALLMDGACGLLSSISQVFWLFMLMRFFNGFAITGAMGICFPYLGEFQPNKYRETILCWMELFWTLGVIALPGIAWMIIPLEFEYITDSFKFRSWNLFVATCSIPSILIGLWLIMFPESPKFLLECGEADEALDVLRDIYYTLMIWFPELFYRFEEFENLHPNEAASVCEVSSVVVKSANATLDQNEFCGEPLADSVFLHTLIIGLACIPTSFWLPLCVHRLGAKFFLVFSLIVAGGVTVGLYFVTSAMSNLVLSCIFEALTSLGISTVYCVMVDLFPTNLRVMAAALSLTFGRGGALLGNLLFGFLIDLNCVIPIAVFAAMLLVSGLLCLMLPSTGKGSLD